MNTQRDNESQCFRDEKIIPLWARSRSGFTLIELLVVVSIIGLLVAILIPSLKSARNQARTVACLANIRGVAAASLTYAAADAHEQLIPVHRMYGRIAAEVGAYEWGGKSGRGEPTVANDPASSIWGTQFGRGPATRSLNSVVYKSGMADHTDDPGPNNSHWLEDATLNLPTFRCPSDSGYTGLHFDAWENSGLSSYDHYGVSYAASLLWICDAATQDKQLRFYSGTSYLRTASHVPNPANTIYYHENSGRFAWLANLLDVPPAGQEDDHCTGGYFIPPASQGARGTPIKGWHGRPYIFTSSFVDGHAAVVEMHGCLRPAPRLGRYPGMGEAGWHTGSEHFYKCVTVRGDSWQIDTMPAPFVYSRTICDHAYYSTWR